MYNTFVNFHSNFLNKYPLRFQEWGFLKIKLKFKEQLTQMNLVPIETARRKNQRSNSRQKAYGLILNMGTLRACLDQINKEFLKK